MSGPQRARSRAFACLSSPASSPAPGSARRLADLGAEVIKVEQPGAGDDTRGWGPPFMEDKDGGRLDVVRYNLACNRGKRSIAVDFATRGGPSASSRSSRARSDVLVENFKFGGLKQVRPRRREPGRRAQPAARLLLDHRLRPGRPLHRAAPATTCWCRAWRHHGHASSDPADGPRGSASPSPTCSPATYSRARLITAALKERETPARARMSTWR